MQNTAHAKQKVTMTVTESSRLADGIYSLTLAYPEGAAPALVRPGQFAGIYPPDPTALLPRPISICRWNSGDRSLRFVYRVAGKGTNTFTRLLAGDTVDMLGILGNGYDLSRLEGKRVLLMGGGIGVPPMLELAAALSGKEGTEVTAVLGYRDDQLFLSEEMAQYAKVLIATEDGSAGVRGNVLDVVRACEAGAAAYDVICACGPLPMLRAIKAYAQETGAKAYLSLEERMACGVGVCLGCVTKTTEVDAHSQVHNARICTEGPVFDAREVVL